MRKKQHYKKRNAESGFTLIELLIAGVVLVFGMLSIMGLLMLAIGNNGRSKIDSTATMLTQGVLEQLTAKLAGGGPGSITDNANCNNTGNTWTISDAPGGANLVGGKIDFSQAQGPLLGAYAMNYTDCNNNVPVEYDVRWNIQTIDSKGTFLATVGARPKNGTPVRFAFSLPVTMRAYVTWNGVTPP